MTATIAYMTADGKMCCGDTAYPTRDKDIKEKEEYILANGVYGYWYTHHECGFTVQYKYHWVGNPTEAEKEKLLEAVAKYYNYNG